MGVTRSIGKQETAAVKLPVNGVNTADSSQSAHEWSVCGNYASKLQSMETSEPLFIDPLCKNRIGGSSCDLSSTVSLQWHSPFGSTEPYADKSWGMDLARTYAWAPPASPCACGWTRASRSHQNPRQTLQSPQMPPHERMSHGAHAHSCLGCQYLLEHSVYVPDHGGQSSVSYWRLLSLACPVPQCLSSPLAMRPPILLSPSGHTAHPGFPPPERRRFPWISQLRSDVCSSLAPVMSLWLCKRTSGDQQASELWI